MPIAKAAVKHYLLDLQERIVSRLQAIDGLPFRTDQWDRPEGGGGISRLIEEGGVLERGGVNFSHVLGTPIALFGHGAPAGTGRAGLGKRWDCRWSCTRAIPMRPRYT